MNRGSAGAAWAARRAPGPGAGVARVAVVAWCICWPAGVAQAQGAPAIPAVNLFTEPLALGKAKPTLTLTLALSVEWPTVGGAYMAGAVTGDDASYATASEYVGYFDPNGCYSYDMANRYFVRSGPASAHACDGSKFSGNFMNWATASAIDILRYGLTGGDRVVDTPAQTVLQRAMLPGGFFNAWQFPSKHLLPALAAGAVPTALLAGHTGTVYVANCSNRIFFGTERTGECDRPGNNGNLGLGSYTADAFFLARVQVCDAAEAASRPALCVLQPSGHHKPVGHLQRHSDRLRVAVFGYLNDYGTARYGGVLRAPMKYVGPKTFDSEYNLQAGANPLREWNESTGEFVRNPEGAAEGISGAINYVNQFGRTGTRVDYKGFDPVSELYYEALRYIQGLDPTPQAVSNVTASHRDGFPVHTTWTDPFPAVAGSGAAVDDHACVDNNILGIGDVRANADRSLPGGTSTDMDDFARPARPAFNEPDFVAWTRVVGAFESGEAMSYVDGNGVTRTTGNPGTRNAANSNLDTRTLQYCCGGGSYYMAGAAYWARTHDIRPAGLAGYPAAKARPGMRARTYMIDVNESGQMTAEAQFKRNQFYLAAKYGGFIDRSQTGNPFLGKDGRTLDNSNWSRPVPTTLAADGLVAKNYFQGGNGPELLAALDNIFAEVLRASATITNAAVASTRLTTETAIFQGSFDPAKWSGDLARYRITQDDGRMLIGTAEDSQSRFAAAELDRLASPDTRRIFVGKTTPGLTGTATEFRWAALDADHREALRRPATGTPLDSEATGQLRLAYLRGDRSQEAGGAMRRRGSRLGDIVNSGVVFSGKPGNVLGDSAYASFAGAGGTRPDTVFVGANDGMLHAFHADTLAELFAYVPGFLVKHLRELTLPAYVHRNYVDATPEVGEARVGSQWKTVLVSGAGGGGQGVFALDVSNPAGFGAGHVLWEFTDRDDPALGNVIGRPRIVKLRTSAPGAPVEYKHYAVVAGGVNNHVDDGSFSTTGRAAIFLLDLAKSATADWVLGSNYHRIDLPGGDAAQPNGVAGLGLVKGAGGELQLLYAGDLQGQLWKLDFRAAGRAQWTAAGLSAFMAGSTPLPLFRATDAAGRPQPITVEPEVAFGPNRGHIVTFGTGKLLEPADLGRPYPTQSFYALYDNGSARVPDRGHLKQAQAAGAGSIETGRFAWGVPAGPAQAGVRAGWYLDLPGAADGERQVSGITLVNGVAVFGTVEPPAHGCGTGGGRLYAVDLASGGGEYVASTVGLQGQPLVMKMGADQLSDSRSDGRASQQTRYRIVTPGSAGIQVSGLTPDIPEQTILQRSWRQVFNFEQLRMK
jgi:type IV pilus assembly protein PilY1